MLKVKICGITSKEQALAAAEAGADYVGLVFAPSKRQLTVEQALLITKALRAWRGERLSPEIVGVFVNRPAEEVNRLAHLCHLDVVQLSGDETLKHCLTINLPVIKAVHVPPQGDVEAIEKSLSCLQELGLLPLLDAAVPGKYGGTGRTFNWELARSLAPTYAFLLAGGLGPHTVGQAIRTVRPWGVDVSSGVETKGLKDIGKIKAFIAAAREAEQLYGGHQS